MEKKGTVSFSLAAFSVSRPIAASMIFLGVALCGITALPFLPLELLPSLTPTEISIVTHLRGGIAPQEVERTVSIPMEEAMGNLSHLAGMESSSREGESTLYLRFLPGTNTDLTTLEIQENLSKVRSKLPQEAEHPIVSRFAVTDRPVLTIAFSGKALPLEKIRSILQDRLQPQLEKIRGVARVEVVGAREKKFLVDVDTAKLRQRGISWATVLDTLNAANVQQTTGELSQQETVYPVRVMGAIRDANDLPALPISASAGSMPVTLADIARVGEGYLKADSHSRCNGQDVVGLFVYKESPANTLAVVDKVKETLDREAPGLAALNLSWIVTTDQSRFIRDALRSVRNSLLMGALLAVASLLLFLGDWSRIFVVAISIPFSVLGTLFVLFLFGGSLNVMTLAGLALGIGLLMDNNIVVLENIQRSCAVKTSSCIIQAANEMRLPMCASTLTTIVVFLPLLFVSKDIQRTYASLGAVVVAAILFSLFAAISLAPMLANFLPALPVRTKRLRIPMQEITRWYDRSMEKILRRPGPLFGVVAIALALSAWYLFGSPKDVLGIFQEHIIFARVRPPTGASLATANAIMQDLEKTAAGIREVKEYHSFVRKDEMRLTLLLQKGIRRAQTKYAVMDQLRKKAGGQQDAFLYFEGGQQEETLKGLDVEVFFGDPVAMPEIIKKVGKALAGVAALKDLRVRINPNQPEYHLILDRSKIAQAGLSVKDVSDQIHLQMRGMVPTRLYQESGEVETIARLDPEQHKELSAVREILLDAPGFVPGIFLEDLATFKISEGPATIWRKNRKRVVQWLGNIQSESLESVARDVAKVMGKVELPPGCYWDFGDAYKRFVETNRQLRQAFILVLALLFILLTAIFQSYWKPLVLFSAILSSLIGVAAALALSQTAITPAVGIGMMILGGIVINNSILLVDRFTKAVGPQERISQAKLISVCSQRIRPILMTSVTTVLGFLPLALFPGESAGLSRPIAIPLIGGMIVSTASSLFLTPVLYWVIKGTRK